MARHLLGVLEPSVVFQVNCDAGRTPGATSDNATGLTFPKKASHAAQSALITCRIAHRYGEDPNRELA
jgi:hypothetical protein